jgi:hypothetical protein
MLDVDAESLISHLSCALAPADRAAFRRAGETALVTSPVCLGPGSIHRTVTAIWRIYFRPPPEDRGTTWVSGRKRPSKLISEPPKDGHVRRRARIVR